MDLIRRGGKGGRTSIRDQTSDVFPTEAEEAYQIESFNHGVIVTCHASADGNRGGTVYFRLINNTLSGGKGR